MKKQTKLGLVLAAAAVISVSVASLVSARGWVQNGADWYYVNNDGEYVTDTIQSSGNSKFYLGEDGTMQRDYFLEDYNENTYYFGTNGAMVTNTWVAIDSTRVGNTDDYVPDNYWYYFQASGKAMKGTGEKGKKATIDGKKYVFNEYGQMAVGWFGEDGKTFAEDEENPFANAVYYAGGDNDGVLRTGWLTYYDGYSDQGDFSAAVDYTNLYFYFNPSSCKKTGWNSSDQEGEFVTKKINGRTYAFNNEGVMISQWDVYEDGRWDNLDGKVVYFSGEDDGHQVKKGWVYAVPSGSIDSSKHDDDEEVYMYFLSSGDSVRDQFKKINGKWYAFNEKGIMKTGLVIWCPAETEDTTVSFPNGEAGSVKFINTVDSDYAEGDDIAKWGLLQTDASQYIQVDENGVVEYVFDTNKADQGNARLTVGADELKLHLFGDDGARKTGSSNTIEFNDKTYTFGSNTGGNYVSGARQKKYYALGLQLKADPDIRYGIYNTASSASVNANGQEYGMFQFQSTDSGKGLGLYKWNLENNTYQVLTTGGALQKGNNGAKKDADGNYWLIHKGDGNYLRGIWDREVNFSRSFNSFVTKTVQIPDGMTLVNGAYYDICDATMSELKLALPDSEADFNAPRWRCVIESRDNGRDSVHFVYRYQWSGYGYKTDYGEKNKYIPMGMIDNAGGTVTTRFLEVQDACETEWGMTEEEATRIIDKYLVKPNNDHFLNCLWYSGAEKYSHR